MLVSINVVVALCLLTTGSVFAYSRWRIDSIRTLAAPDETQAPSGSPENILLIGNQTRSGQGTAFGSPQLFSGSLSDVLMILHLDPTTDTASLLSIPRDLFVPMPPGSPVGAYQKIDAALNDGAMGPDNLIRTITDDLGIKINHFIEVKFNGFENTVNALGGINVDFPMPVFDHFAGLNISTIGCQHLNGAQALALVRARHLQYRPPGYGPNPNTWPFDPQSDLARIVRDHTFLRILASTAKSQGLTNPIKANAFIGAIINQITVDPSLKNQLVSLITQYRHLSPGTIPETTLPITQVGGAAGYSYFGAAIGDVDFPVQPLDNQVISAWDHSALPAPITPASVNVYNISDRYHLAETTAAALQADGLPIGTVGNGQVPAATTETLVAYHPGQIAQAMAVVKDLSGAVMLQPLAAVPAGTINVNVGSTVSVVGGATNGGYPATTTPSSSTAAPATVAVPTPGGQKPSSASDVIKPWDPRPCSSG
ncbi:MAG: LCP family protein [Acidimicrobiales bacterium]